MKEVWKDIKGYEGFYQVSNLGNVRGLPLKKLRSLNTCNRYNIVLLRKHAGKQKQFKVHRLVAEAFIPNPESKPFVNHINGNKRDNSISNLEWVTHSENMLHSYSIGIHKPTYKKAS